MEQTRNEQLKEKALAILEAARREKIPARLLGGMAIYLSSPCTRQEPFCRKIEDLDFVVAAKKSYLFSKMMEKIGFQGDHQFNSIHGETRLLFTSELTDIDGFVGTFQQCHTLNLEKYFDGTEATIPIACLLLTKLQVVQINRKDIFDSLALLHDHTLSSDGSPEQVLRTDQLFGVLSRDWGWYTTVTDNLVKIRKMLPELGFDAPTRETLGQKLEALLSGAQAAPKNLKWKMRATIGRKMTWYDLPEEKKL